MAFTDADCVSVEPWPWPLVVRLEKEGEKIAVGAYLARTTDDHALPSRRTTVKDRQGDIQDLLD